MKDRMSGELQRRAKDLLDGGSEECGAGVYSSNGGAWSQMENPRDRGPCAPLDHYGRSYFPPHSQECTAKRRRF
jgi:hypothetical protein